MYVGLFTPLAVLVCYHRSTSAFHGLLPWALLASGLLGKVIMTTYVYCSTISQVAEESMLHAVQKAQGSAEYTTSGEVRVLSYHSRIVIIITRDTHSHGGPRACALKRARCT